MVNEKDNSQFSSHNSALRKGFQQTEVGIIPENWKVEPLSKIALFENGKAHEQFIDEQGDFVVVNSKFISTEGRVKKPSIKNFRNGRISTKNYWVSNTIQIGFNNEKKAISRGMYKIRFIKQANKITEDNIPMLQILDSIRFIKDIPDTDQNQSCNRFIAIVKELSPERLNKLKKLVLKYNASTRALTGAIIDMLENDNNTQTIFESLNPATSYNFSISERTLPTKDKWRIK